MTFRWPHLMEKVKNLKSHVIFLEANVPTINQLVRKGRKSKKVKSKAPALLYTLNSDEAAPYPPGYEAPRRNAVCAQSCAR